MNDVEVLVSRFAGRLRELREAAGLSREDLAELAGLKSGGVRDLEQGRRDPSWRTALQLAGALKVEVTAFLAEPAPMPPPTRGRPRKAPQPSRDERSASGATRVPGGKKRAARGRTDAASGRRKGTEK
jgi:transcriptional regulator with XRE-family HTH domain